LLPDLSKQLKRETTPELHLKANTVLSVMTIVASFTLAALLYLILAFRPDTHPLVYVTAGLLLAMGGWHIQSLIRTIKLKKQWKNRTPLTEGQPGMKSVSTARLLEQADFADVIPTSVTENTTRHLAAKPRTTR
jgi:hypothetical protein